MAFIGILSGRANAGGGNDCGRLSDREAAGGVIRVAAFRPGAATCLLLEWI